MHETDFIPSTEQRQRAIDYVRTEHGGSLQNAIDTTEDGARSLAESDPDDPMLDDVCELLSTLIHLRNRSEFNASAD